MTTINDKNWISVESSNIARIKYNRSSRELLVEFKDGAQYLYQNVPQDTFLFVITADSVGSTFNTLVKSQPIDHPYERLAA